MSATLNSSGGFLNNVGSLTALSGAGDIRMSDTEPVTQNSLKDFADLARSTSDGSEVIRQLNALLRGEISAAETYRNVLDKVSEGDHAENAGLLREIQVEHGRACQSLRDRIRELGGEASDSSGAWGVWAQVVQGSMTLFGGDRGGLKALKEGEEHGLKDYNSAIPAVDPSSAQLIQNQLLPSQQRHINLLDQLIGSPTAG